jgi:hypothetical protein
MAQQVTDGFNKTSIYSLTGSPSHGLLENDLPPCCTKLKLAPAEGAVEKPWQTLRKLRNEKVSQPLIG